MTARTARGGSPVDKAVPDTMSGKMLQMLIERPIRLRSGLLFKLIYTDISVVSAMCKQLRSDPPVVVEPIFPKVTESLHPSLMGVVKKKQSEVKVFSCVSCPVRVFSKESSPAEPYDTAESDFVDITRSEYLYAMLEYHTKQDTKYDGMCPRYEPVDIHNLCKYTVVVPKAEARLECPAVKENLHQLLMYTVQQVRPDKVVYSCVKTVLPPKRPVRDSSPVDKGAEEDKAEKEAASPLSAILNKQGKAPVYSCVTPGVMPLHQSAAALCPIKPCPAESQPITAESAMKDYLNQENMRPALMEVVKANKHSYRVYTCIKRALRQSRASSPVDVEEPDTMAVRFSHMLQEMPKGNKVYTCVDPKREVGTAQELCPIVKGHKEPKMYVGNIAHCLKVDNWRPLLMNVVQPVNIIYSCVKHGHV